MTRHTILTTALLLALCGVGGALAQVLHLPMPWMIGALIMSGVCIVLAARAERFESYSFPLPLRTAFIGMIGVMIGGQATPELLRQMTQLPVTLAALVLFIGIAHAGNVVIFRRIGKFDAATAFYSGTPGGLMESILLGEAAGADARILTLQQFLRIILVVTLVPLGLSLWLGHPVGSAAGDMGQISGDTATLPELILVAAAGAAGLGLARLVRLPAGHLTGPLLLTAGLSLSGVVTLHVPFWLIALAQVVVGASLGLRFKGVSLALLRRSVGLTALSVTFMLALGMGISLVLVHLTDIPFLHLLISFAPGGVTEMSIIALSLAANPALVTLHHVLRILLTVMELTLVTKLRPQMAGPR
ncbi:AbrB family transcriptional regulator [Primorskyibacter aestuariivivens]|uniref:AbrB family transcriptional regulator n=1 Tax=Primorskyibacter aestuariivivens TaxID=1888912 RepID=UPI0022FFCE23|nr:AbrB family transcriptional regulator [Primorskyibacter aestuariivivens]MDA7428935.1 AbrB family transcriptional regulator [Primorskyibacter aestuariivivens]